MISDVSTFQSITCKLEWKLYDLDKHEQFMQNGQYLTSKQFSNPKCPSVKWELRIYPKTYNSGIFVSLVQVGLEFTHKAAPSTVKAKFNIYTLDNDGNKNFCSLFLFLNTKQNQINIKFSNHKRLYQVFQSNDNLEEGKDYVLVNDSTEALNLDFLLIFCEVEFVPYDLKCENDVVNYSSGATSQLSLKMFKEGILTDCVIEIGNESINTHRFILAKNSVVFQKMFEQMGMTEVLNGKIKIVDSSPECFKAMLEYFYSGEIDKKTIEKYSEDLFSIAHKYEVKQLMEICENYMAANIDAENFGKLCLFAEFYHLSKLAKACVNFLSVNKVFLMSKEWDQFKSLNKELAIRLMEKNIFDRKDSSDKKKEIVSVMSMNEEQLKTLEQAFQTTCYPGVCMRTEIAQNIGLSQRVVEVWFQNRRHKERERLPKIQYC
uniref:Uncharacterized protein n=1 Tax=Meloidogyne enterolobii TaxID=390850 RepID=A0A6V7WKD2_MELEN|nr:unnamed protein product [Meloidogyne enterolobii]